MANMMAQHLGNLLADVGCANLTQAQMNVFNNSINRIKHKCTSQVWMKFNRKYSTEDILEGIVVSNRRMSVSLTT